MKRYNITVGAKTTVNGTVRTGYGSWTIDGQAIACEGDEVECPACDSTGVIVCDGPHLPQLMGGRAAALDGDLCHCKCDPPPRLIANQTLQCQQFDDVEVAPRPRANTQPATPVAPHHPTNQPYRSTFAPAPSPPAPAVRNDAEALEPGFYVLPHSMSGEQVLAQLAPNASPKTLYRLKALNPAFYQGFKAGEIFVLGDPDNPTQCMRQEAQLMATAEQIRDELAPLSDAEADFMAEHQDEIAAILGETSIGLGIASSMLASHLDNLHSTLAAMDKLYQDMYRKHGHLKAPEFFTERQRLMTRLDAHLQASFIRRDLGINDYRKLKNALGMSSRSIVHHWKKAGVPGQLPGYATHLGKVARASRYMKAGGYIGVLIGGVSGYLSTQQVCSDNPDSVACERVRFVEGGKFLLGTAGGSLGAYAGARSTSSICMALGITTAIGGIACAAALIGIGSLVGTSIGTEAGEKGGDLLYEVVRP